MKQMNCASLNEFPAMIAELKEQGNNIVVYSPRYTNKELQAALYNAGQEPLSEGIGLKNLITNLSPFSGCAMFKNFDIYLVVAQIGVALGKPTREESERGKSQVDKFNDRYGKKSKVTDDHVDIYPSIAGISAVAIDTCQSPSLPASSSSSSSDSYSSSDSSSSSASCDNSIM